ncbi:cysteine protease rdl2-related [Anaeramoeba ignava]|uniref:Cysteine protease rdl2-related n=1 Tax=Anaeramoeba ignava TaxID=1746090 RepID=A0A9Q0RDX5_ANAIG|nr:cysteine protease rdl2-related [Anaeramoeba ignava]
MRYITLFAILFALATCMNDEMLFNHFKNKFNKKYSAEEEAMRFKIFQQNLRHIEEHNSGESSYKLGITQFADLTNAEYQQLYLRPMKVNHEVPIIRHKELPKDDPTDLDWRKKGAVTPIKDQGGCGSCWAFSTTGMIEGCTVVDNTTEGGHELISLSEQQIVDCDKENGQEGCTGGYPHYAMDWVTSINGLCTEKAYPYTGEDDTCKTTKDPKFCTAASTLDNHYEVTVGDEGDLETKLIKYGPISVAIDASSWDFELYTSGIYFEDGCSTTDLDHAVLVVGYHNEATVNKRYWIVKNSWGTSWGIQGYIWMSKDRDNNCGIASDAWWGTGCHNV